MNTDSTARDETVRNAWEGIVRFGVKAWDLVAAVTIWTARTTWAALVAIAGVSWAVLTWTGRVSLWLLLWPLGLWRSVRHGRKRRDALADRRHAETLEALRGKS